MTFTEGTEKLAQALLLPINPAAVILLGIYTVVWGAWVANPFWTVFDHAALYTSMANFMPEYVWGIVAVAMGLITVYGAVKRHYAALVRGAASSGFFWFVVAVFYFIGDVASTGGITALVFSVYAAFIYLNIRVNFKDDRTSPYILAPPRPRFRGK
jgi:FtsH-binding integral membrane protein